MLEASLHLHHKFCTYSTFFSHIEMLIHSPLKVGVDQTTISRWENEQNITNVNLHNGYDLRVSVPKSFLFSSINSREQSIPKRFLESKDLLILYRDLQVRTTFAFAFKRGSVFYLS